MPGAVSGSLLTLAAEEDTVAGGTLPLFLYGLGLGALFLIAGLAADCALRWARGCAHTSQLPSAPEASCSSPWACCCSRASLPSSTFGRSVPLVWGGPCDGPTRRFPTRRDTTNSDTGRIVLIALGVALLVVVLLPTLFMGGMMAAMMSGSMGGGMPWLMPTATILLVLVGVGLIVAGVRMGSRGHHSEAEPPPEPGRRV